MKKIRVLKVIAMGLMVLGLMNGPVRAQLPPEPPDYLELMSFRPGATLLFPNFEVELAKTSGMTTVISITNAMATATLARVTVWSNLGVPVLGFNVYLTGYDVQAINMRDVLNGILPRTASDGQDPTDTISPQGIFSQDINFASCTGILPYTQPLEPVLIAHTQAALTGNISPIFGLCAGTQTGTRAQGYVTVDTVNQCTTSSTPADPGYFLPGGAGIATSQNHLSGEFWYLNPSRVNGIAWITRSGLAIPLQADATMDALTTIPGNYTFYGRLVNWLAFDNRQPLPTTFIARYLNGGAFETNSSLIVFRDSKVNQTYFACPAIPGFRPPWFPLSQEQIVMFDEQENPFETQPSPVFPPFPPDSVIPFPTATQRVEVGGPDFPVPFDFGWLFLNLNTIVAGQVGGLTDAAAAQAWVYEVYDTTGRFNTGHHSTPLDSALTTPHATIPGIL